MRSKELSIKRQDSILSKHKSGEGYEKTSAALKVSKNTVASMEEVWNYQDSPRPGRPAKLSNQRSTALVREVAKEP
jgi:transposase